MAEITLLMRCARFVHDATRHSLPLRFGVTCRPRRLRPLWKPAPTLPGRTWTQHVVHGSTRGTAFVYGKLTTVTAASQSSCERGWTGDVPTGMTRTDVPDPSTPRCESVKLPPERRASYEHGRDQEDN